MSRIGKAPITVPAGVDVTLDGRSISVKGPKGTLEREIPGTITITPNAAVGDVTLSGSSVVRFQAPSSTTGNVTILDGAAVLTIGGNEVRAKAGETVLMPADVPHALHAEERFKMFLIMVKGSSSD